MHDVSLNGMRVAILATDGVEQAQLFELGKALEEAGVQKALVAPHTGKIQAMKRDQKGAQLNVDVTLDRADGDKFDAVVLPGGTLSADALRAEKLAQNFVARFDKQAKPIAMICRAPWLLISAGCIRGRTVTSYHTIQDDIRNAGGNWVDQEVVRDRNWISSRQTADLPAFNREMLRLLAESQSRPPKVA
jgi:protease I